MISVKVQFCQPNNFPPTAMSAHSPLYNTEPISPLPSFQPSVQIKKQCSFKSIFIHFVDVQNSLFKGSIFFKGNCVLNPFQMLMSQMAQYGTITPTWSVEKVWKRENISTKCQNLMLWRFLVNRTNFIKIFKLFEEETNMLFTFCVTFQCYAVSDQASSISCYNWLMRVIMSLETLRNDFL